MVPPSGVASPKLFRGGGIFDFRRITLLFEIPPLKAQNDCGEHGPWTPWLRLWYHLKATKFQRLPLVLLSESFAIGLLPPGVRLLHVAVLVGYS